MDEYLRKIDQPKPSSKIICHNESLKPEQGQIFPIVYELGAQGLVYL